MNNQQSSRSLRVSELGAKEANEAFLLSGWNQADLAGKSHCTRQTVGRFFNQHPVDKAIFQRIAEQLGLRWEAIADIEILMSDGCNNENCLNVSARFVIDESDWEEVDVLLTKIRQKAKSFSITVGN